MGYGVSSCSIQHQWDFCIKIRIQKGNFNISWTEIMMNRQKLGTFLLTKVFLKMIQMKNIASESCSPNLIFIKENNFWEDSVDFWPQKLTLKTENAQFLLARHYFCAQNIKISFEYADLYAKISLILDTAARNSITKRRTLLNNNTNPVFSDSGAPLKFEFWMLKNTTQADFQLKISTPGIPMTIRSSEKR